ncbi:hypothetical protein FRB95_004463 [Tulasnella sp. JGI-2019a]|nr:hypothetical protein FRB95_004463 [Tulasnella sp. JGI-2019a]
MDIISQHLQHDSSNAGDRGNSSGIMADDEMDDLEFDLDDDVDIFDAGAPNGRADTKRKEETDEEKQLRILEGWTSSVPYACESLEEMQQQLEVIVSKLLIAAESRHWEHLVAWDGALASWLGLKYPFPRALRAKLARFYYELILIPSIDPKFIHLFALSLDRTIATKLGHKRKLELEELVLPWEPLWQVLKKEVWPSKRETSSSRNLHNILLHVAETCREYFAPSEIPSMLDTFLPLFTQETAATVFTIITSFLPRSHAQIYIPFVFKTWEAFHSYKIEDCVLQILGQLSISHVAGKASDYPPEGCLEWKDVGIYTEAEWATIMRACLASMSVPVGNSKGGSTTSQYADRTRPSAFKKNSNRFSHLAQIIIYSMSVDGPQRVTAEGQRTASDGQEKGYLAGSKALDSLDRLITSVESYFHPSNYGAWTLALTAFIQWLAAELSVRWNEEQQPSCKTPVAQRLTPEIKRAVIETLRTPALLAMFSKDALSTGYAQAALRYMSILEPDLIMPQLLERAYGGLESINETHRTTAAIGALAAVSTALTKRSTWFKGQRHLVPLLELCLPGIDINDSVKTVSTCMFIVSALQFVKIGDLNVTGGVPLAHDAPAEDVVMQVEGAETPSQERRGMSNMSEEELEEDDAAKQSTAGFADWVVSFFRRVFALYENLPEEGGKSGKTGGKTEDTVVKSLNTALDVVCANLSDPLFEVVLNLVFDYATTNVRANGVRSIGNVITSLSRARPKATINKFLPFTIKQIEIEMAAGASSVRTTSNTSTTVPSDTTLHWNMAILRSALAFGGRDLVAHRKEILQVMKVLRGAKHERAYSGHGRMVNRILAALTGTYPVENRLVNPRQWNDPYFERSHHRSWGKQFSESKEVEVEWHQPSTEEIAFAVGIMTGVISPTMDALEDLVKIAPQQRDAVWKNDFCRMIYLVRSAWTGCATLLLHTGPFDGEECIDEDEYVPGLKPEYMQANAAFALSDPQDPRYKAVKSLRERFGRLLHTTFLALLQEKPVNGDAADSVDAIIQLLRASDVWFFDYGVQRATFDAHKKHFVMTRELVKTHSKQRQFPRLVWIKRATLYHYGRLYQHTYNRERTALDDQLLLDLMELSMSPYTRVRKHAQSTLINATASYRRATRLIMPKLIQSLERELAKGKDADPDRQKGALYVLSDKGIATFCLNLCPEEYISAVLRCQSQEKPSIQNLVAKVVQETVAMLSEESLATTSFLIPHSALQESVESTRLIYPLTKASTLILKEATSKLDRVAGRRKRQFDGTMTALQTLATDEKTHWRYQQYAIRYAQSCLCRDAEPSASLSSLFINNVVSDHPSVRTYAQRGVAKILWHVKLRSYSADRRELWLNPSRNPLRKEVAVRDPAAFLADLEKPWIPGQSDIFFVDKEDQGFLTWAKTVKGYRAPPQSKSAFTWEPQSKASLAAVGDAITGAWLTKLITHLSQEGAKAGTTSSVDLRLENILFIKSLFKTFEGSFLQGMLECLSPLLLDEDKYKLRAGCEILAGILRGSKHWPMDSQTKLWTWVMERLPRLFDQIKPDTVQIFETFISVQLADRDPRRNQPLIDFINSQTVDFNASSAFAVSKRLTTIGTMADSLGVRFDSSSHKLIELYFNNIQTQYAEIRSHIAVNIGVLIGIQWHPRFRTPADILAACASEKDPLQLRKSEYLPRIQEYIDNFAKWREERLPPPRVSQSTYDRVGLTLLQWLWGTAHLPQAPSIFPYVMPLLPEIFKMAELNDSSELQLYSGAVLNVLSSIAAPPEFVEPVMDALIDAVKTSPSWRIRLSVLPVLQVFYFRNLLNLADTSVKSVLDVLLECIRDENVEVRETAAKTLSGVIRCSQRQRILPLKDRFTKLARKTKLPKRQDKDTFTDAIRTLHSAVLGLCALVDAYPYSVEPWMPEIIETLGRYSSDPIPVSTSIRKCAASFKQTHQDTWAMDQLAFSEDQMQALSTIVSGTSYYA